MEQYAHKHIEKKNPLKQGLKPPGGGKSALPIID